ncbi:leucine--tRNA ligase [Candidatus Walczuchella monophlebidarum]|uniref:Leucine--tRNA ligase n=1 Tax=Candidatus Walczuchella monophlebidarum TaxID=1415657 RepID=A0A068DWZ3_9FLAO|nr:leucine--tRNA ligase [Candidatus Walczuchella monophlebidarum]AID37553.1 leucyl-tRNA synthetase [Candidatus Walczuchella monophlebidarum]
MEYTFREIENRWQKRWELYKIFKADNHSKKPKYYVLDMFPYPSGAGLHVGHPLGYIASDIYTRYKRSENYNVLHPIGFDAFGLPSEQYAIQTGQHPSLTTKVNIQRYKKQLKRLGLSFDWSREVCTSDPDYYRWTQWIFLQLYNSWYDISLKRARPINELISIFEKEGNLVIRSPEENRNKFTAKEWNSFPLSRKEEILQKYRLAFRSETTVNWCPHLGTVLANDEVIEGKSERGGYPVYQKKTIQWSIRITSYADRLLQGLENIDWPESIKEAQKQWIGKSFGLNLFFFVIDNPGTYIEIFTPRPETIFGVSFIVLAPEHELWEKITIKKQINEVKTYVEESKKRNDRERLTHATSGVFTGAYVAHPFTNERIPVYISDYVLNSYGTGAIMAVPAHNTRDHMFAKKYGLKIIEVISGGKDVYKKAYDIKKGECIHSDFLNGLSAEEALKKSIEKIEEKGLGYRTVNYRFRNAVFSRQRYWGEPIPIYYKKGVPFGIPEKKLPLLLPIVDKYMTTQEGKPPLGRATHWAWYEKKQKIVSNKLIDEKTIFPLETSTMPGWAGSSWYFLRYMNTDNDNSPIDTTSSSYWKNVDLYVGGKEHSTGHLIYSRFLHKFLKDFGWVSTEEPFKKLLNQGMVLEHSAMITRIEGTQRFISSGLIRNQEKTQQFYVDIHLLKNGDELDIDKFKKYHPEFSKAEFSIESGKFFCKRKIEKMSKSKFNVRNPDDIYEKYGADTLRIHEMFLGPLNQTKLWNTRGIKGAHQFLKKFWRLFHSRESFYVEESSPSIKELKILHCTIKKIREDIPNFSFNTSISALMIATNKLSEIQCKSRKILEPLVILLAPFAPHISEELWHRLNHKDFICFVPMPKCEKQYITDNIIEYPITFNGKLRFKMNFPIGTPQKFIKKEVLRHPETKKYLQGKKIKNTIIIQNKIINIVV